MCCIHVPSKLTVLAQGAIKSGETFTREAVHTVLAGAILARVAGTLVDICQAVGKQITTKKETTAKYCHGRHGTRGCKKYHVVSYQSNVEFCP